LLSYYTNNSIDITSLFSSTYQFISSKINISTTVLESQKKNVNKEKAPGLSFSAIPIVRTMTLRKRSHFSSTPVCNFWKHHQILKLLSTTELPSTKIRTAITVKMHL
jgi:hypothetical protein